MRKWFLIIFWSVLYLSSLFAYDFKVQKDIQLVPEDITLIQNPIKDEAGNFCALIKISTDVQSFDQIEASLGITDIHQNISETWIYVSPGEKRLYLSKKDYTRLTYDINIPIESNKVYALTLIKEGQDFTKELPIRVKITATDATAFVDEMPIDSLRHRNVSPGKHQIIVKRADKQIFTRDIQVSMENLLFEFIEVKLQILPADATVYIDNVVTPDPESIFLKRGTYIVRVEKQGYDSKAMQIKVHSNDRLFTLALDKMARIQVMPRGSVVLLDDKPYTNERMIPLSLGTHKVAMTYLRAKGTASVKIVENIDTYTVNVPPVVLNPLSYSLLDINIMNFVGSKIGTVYHTNLWESQFDSRTPGRLRFPLQASLFDMYFSGSNTLMTICSLQWGMAYQPQYNGYSLAATASTFLLSGYVPNDVYYKKIGNYYLEEIPARIIHNQLETSLDYFVSDGMQISFTAGIFQRKGYNWYRATTPGSSSSQYGSEPVPDSEVKDISPYIEGVRPYIGINLRWLPGAFTK